MEDYERQSSCNGHCWQKFTPKSRAGCNNWEPKIKHYFIGRVASQDLGYTIFTYNRKEVTKRWCKSVPGIKIGGNGNYYIVLKLILLKLNTGTKFGISNICCRRRRNFKIKVHIDTIWLSKKALCGVTEKIKILQCAWNILQTKWAN